MSRFPTHLPLHKPHAVVQRTPEFLQQVRRLHLRNLMNYQRSVERSMGVFEDLTFFIGFFALLGRFTGTECTLRQGSAV